MLDFAFLAQGAHVSSYKGGDTNVANLAGGYKIIARRHSSGRDSRPTLEIVVPGSLHHIKIRYA